MIRAIRSIELERVIVSSSRFSALLLCLAFAARAEAARTPPPHSSGIVIHLFATPGQKDTQPATVTTAKGDRTVSPDS